MKTPATRRLIAVALATSAIGFTLPAFAAEADEPQANDPQMAQSDAASEDSGAIIVTARRRSETLQSTPVAITAVNTAMLEAKGAVNIGDLQGAAPGLLITQQNSGAQAANISIRGLTYADIEKSQTPTVGVLVDGVVIGTNTGQLQDAFDVAQIEVLRGPQGTLFGANTIGGVINIQRSKPTMELGLKAEATYARFGTFSAKAIGNYGDGETWGVKAWYFHNETDGFYRNVTRNVSAGWSNAENYGASLLFKPAGSGFEAQLTVAQVEQVFDPVVSNITNSSEVFCGFIPARECNRNSTTDLYTTFGDAASSNYKAPEATLELNYDAGVVKLTSITGWRKSTEAQTQDFDGSSVDLYYVDRRQNYEQWSQELRAAGELFDGFDYVVGGFYFKSDYDLTQWSRVFGFAPTVPPTTFDLNSQHVVGRTESYAAFGDFNWKVSDTVRISFGGRYSHDKKELFNGFAGGKLIDPNNIQRSQFVPVGTGKASFNKFTPKIGVDWRPNNDTMLYASWSRGYRSGGFSPRAATAATASTPFQPETVDSYEVGVKLTALNGKLDLNLAGFVSDYKDMQQNLTVPGGPTGNQTVTGNVPGGALIKGIEFDGTLRVTENFRMTASLAFLDSNFRDFVACGAYAGGPVATNACGTGLVPFDYSANRLIYAPDFTASLGAEYTYPTSFGDISTNLSWRHISPYDQQLSAASLTPTLNSAGAATRVTVNGNDPRVRTTTQDLVDAALTFNFDLNDTKAYVRVFGRNLLNEKTTTHAFTVAGLWSFGMALEPRTYGATVGVRF
ncbi:MAG: TonB-dependent receptor [Novosphingobium sp. 28-62-57]|uniref:TonB-dependent receptor n=1 Tax=unclassified Novosphingobium TaxID=2644732 RepID=UPI000BDB40D4|nr:MULTISPECIES: TonB-dependent receptor [unclassified Novosphingobium]OYW49180.1 MAG: TonB-dependent receptor [Novosphingobium sp. 12-62-10]OYZ09791.1 MAG: TonB-dependent receptor [Novosphingobium sp. 28-62-57]OZA36526.1 MAG: TonB-dependent receptor [Novosphingobium sp. 17-62-9]HQS69193.1 TonB-dependent receptor [Novosphingobium sp.]